MSLRLNAQVRRLWTAIDKAIVGRDDCPMTKAALGDLQRSVEVEFATDVAARGAATGDGATPRARRYYFATRRLTAKVEKLQEELAILKEGAKKNGRIADEWVVRTFIANPHVTGRALAETIHLAAGTDATVVGRTSIKKIKDAWVEMYKEMAFNNLAAVFASHWRRMNDRRGAIHFSPRGSCAGRSGPEGHQRS